MDEFTTESVTKLLVVENLIPLFSLAMRYNPDVAASCIHSVQNIRIINAQL